MKFSNILTCKRKTPPHYGLSSAIVQAFLTDQCICKITSFIYQAASHATFVLRTASTCLGCLETLAHNESDILDTAPTYNNVSFTEEGDHR